VDQINPYRGHAIATLGLGSPAFAGGGDDSAARPKVFQNKGNPIAASAAVHRATITVKPPNTTAITLVSSGIIGRY